MKTHHIAKSILSAIGIIAFVCFLGMAVGCSSLTQPRQPDPFDVAIERALSDLFASPTQSSQR